MNRSQTSWTMTDANEPASMAPKRSRLLARASAVATIACHTPRPRPPSPPPQPIPTAQTVPIVRGRNRVSIRAMQLLMMLHRQICRLVQKSWRIRISMSPLHMRSSHRPVPAPAPLRMSVNRWTRSRTNPPPPPPARKAAVAVEAKQQARPMVARAGMEALLVMVEMGVEEAEAEEEGEAAGAAARAQMAMTRTTIAEAITTCIPMMTARRVNRERRSRRSKRMLRRNRGNRERHHLRHRHSSNRRVHGPRHTAACPRVPSARPRPLPLACASPKGQSRTMGRYRCIAHTISLPGTSAPAASV